MSTVSTRPSRLDRGWIVRLIIGLIVLTLLVIFVVQNGTTVRIHLYFWRLSTHLNLALVLAAVLGFLVGWIVSWLLPRLRRRGRPAV